jgi:PAT family beta-lactamase induction signal transducer AmpG
MGKTSEDAGKLQLKNWKSILKSLYQVFFLRVSLIMGIAVFGYNIGRGLTQALMPVFTVQELGWTDSHYSQIFATVNMISGLLGMFVAGALIDFFGKIRMMTIYLITLISVVVVFTLMKSYWHHEIFIYFFFAGFFILDTFITIAVFAIAMQLCWKRISATQFTLFMAIANLGLATGARLLGPFTTNLSWEFVILSLVVFFSVMLILIRHIQFDNHLKQVNRLEEIQLEADFQENQLIPDKIPVSAYK